jgi:hypothetical protein
MFRTELEGIRIGTFRDGGWTVMRPKGGTGLITVATPDGHMHDLSHDQAERLRDALEEMLVEPCAS